jgi:hypothetical protein
MAKKQNTTQQPIPLWIKLIWLIALMAKWNPAKNTGGGRGLPRK